MLKVKTSHPQQPIQIPQMGFYDHTVNNDVLNMSESSSKYKENDKSAMNDSTRSDQVVLESTEAIYFAEKTDTGIYEIKVFYFIYSF